ncbi:hypothetical protein H257_07000 [Aphanomyces astaci]|uniref:Uncharacterized protein n=1 Tax=Aphanomyces astaci TaxID=112090 RepID=W4GJ93_APHAT|nr:hypothetical protein H257_07000 [Aphanomyces astaci]ETV79775.1 hypothetical protein H257_07000 [Aphanomyces astaci]RHY22438.1 hypothetical protein DYB36_011828 [Aphanomyces astaci]RHY47477.1 hypothetical protein DYB38_012181 [Aphanomyces astaci]RHY82160.1 hypothetical protein DYB26_011116 [Aphanomyces astaci]RHZ02634.1 hypothetical protein DYB35_013388 [Aphanomyces astaci]|eukprot:XP_009830711.1 hypothetical protein H257_07000 [Aphanomyces astaci]
MKTTSRSSMTTLACKGPAFHPKKIAMRYSPYSAKRPTLPDYVEYLEDQDMYDTMAALTDVETPTTSAEGDFDEDLVRLSLDNDIELVPGMSLAWSTEDISILLALFDKEC